MVQPVTLNNFFASITAKSCSSSSDATATALNDGANALLAGETDSPLIGAVDTPVVGGVEGAPKTDSVVLSPEALAADGTVATDAPISDGGAPATDQKQRGVIRLLEAGHFHGVADARLRLNFAAELEGHELPPLSAPHGNGKAYAKFAAQYEASQTPPPAPGPDSAADPVDPVTTDAPAMFDALV